MLTAHFGPPLESLTMLDVAAIFEEFRPEYPSFRQIPIAGSMSVDAIPREEAVETIVSSALPRVMMASADEEFAVFLQTDRISVGWMRQTPLSITATYPGFEEMRKRLDFELSRLQDWLRKNKFPDFAPDVVELAYNNAFDMGTEERRRLISDVLTFFKNPRKAKMTAFNMSWIELMRPEETDASQLSGSIRVQSGPGLAPDGTHVLLFNMVASAAVKGQQWSGVGATFEEMHDRIVQIFSGSIQPEARI